LNRPAEEAAEAAELARGAIRCEGVARVQAFIIEIEICRAAKFVKARTRQNVDAPETDSLVFSRERVGIDTDFTDSLLRRKATACKSVDIDLTAVGTRRGSRESSQSSLEFVRVVRQRL